ERMRMALDALLAFVVDGGRAGSRRDAVADESGHRERTQVLHLLRQVAEALAEEQRRSERAERFSADALCAPTADVRVDADRQQRLVRVILVELVLDAGLEVVEAALRVAFVGLHLLVRRSEPDAEVLRPALRHVDRKVRLARRGLVAFSRKLSTGDGRKRQLVGDEWIFGRKRG